MKKNEAALQGSSVTASPAGSSLVSSDSPASRGPSTSPSSINDTRESTLITSPPQTLTPRTNDSPKNSASSPNQSSSLQRNDQVKSHYRPPQNQSIAPPTSSSAPVAIRINEIGMEKAKNFSNLKLPPIPNLIPSPNYSNIVGQKRTRTLADAKIEMKRHRPSVISCGPLLRGTPVRVIQKVQKVRFYIENDKTRFIFRPYLLIVYLSCLL